MQRQGPCKVLCFTQDTQTSEHNQAGADTFDCLLLLLCIL